MNEPSSPLRRYRSEIDEGLRKAVLHMGEESRLRAACEQALLSGGKRLRPAIVLAVAEALGAQHSVIKAALATEFFHTASLIADDLPCMDDAEDRRQRPTLHRAFGEDIALLATYALIAEGYRFVAANAFELKRLRPEQPWERVGLLALENATRNTGLQGTTGGQYLDLHPPAELDGTLAKLIHMKTTTLFEISFVFGWLFGGGDPDRLSGVTELARHLGLAYQIADDLDDVEEDARVGRRVNYALTFGVDRARQQLFESVGSCETHLASLGLRGEVLLQLSTMLRQRAEAA